MRLTGLVLRTKRICRWARERTSGLAPISGSMPTVHRVPVSATSSPTHAAAIIPAASPSSTDLKSFVAAKDPKGDVKFAATVAYFYRFESPLAERKDEIDAEILQNACRLAGRNRVKNPLVALNNAKKRGLLDSGSEAGKFAINTVGENLVAMALPDDSAPKSHRTVKPNKKKK